MSSRSVALGEIFAGHAVGLPNDVEVVGSVHVTDRPYSDVAVMLDSGSTYTTAIWDGRNGGFRDVRHYPDRGEALGDFVRRFVGDDMTGIVREHLNRLAGEIGLGPRERKA